MQSQNGWHVYTSPPTGRSKWITGRTAPGDVNVILEYLAERFDSEVESVRQDWSWGWAFRAIRGQTSGFSNHASGTAIDLNAPAHPLGKAGTFSGRQREAIHTILHDLDGTVRWGGDYSGRKDEMHFEIDAGEAKVRAIADRIRRGQIGKVTPEKTRGAAVDAALDDLSKASGKPDSRRRRMLRRARRALRRIPTWSKR